MTEATREQIHDELIRLQEIERLAGELTAAFLETDDPWPPSWFRLRSREIQAKIKEGQVK